MGNKALQSLKDLVLQDLAQEADAMPADSPVNRSLQAYDTDSSANAGSPLRLGDLPLDCVISILAFLTPLQVCRLAMVSRAFWSASQSDALWESFLPANYAESCKGSSLEVALAGPLKELYRLWASGPVAIGPRGQQSLQLLPKNGGVKMSFAATDCDITWGSDARYWGQQQEEGSIFPMCMHLKSVCWLHAYKRVAVLLPPGSYTVSWRVSDADFRCFEPLQLSVSRPGGELLVQRDIQVARRRSSGQSAGWHEWLIGDICVGAKGEGVPQKVHDRTQYFVELDVVLQQTGGSWKSGLLLDAICLQSN